MPETTRPMSPWRGWGPVIVLPAVVWWLASPEWPRWLLMWGLSVAIFIGCKWLSWRRTPVIGVPGWLHLGYLLFWPGMNAREFLCSERFPPGRRPGGREWASAGLNVFLGATLLWGVSRLVPPRQELLLGWIGMFGLILMLHFGVFHLLSCAWRMAGINARPLMNSPLASTGVSEFWGKRWNTAFRDLTHRFLFRPLTGVLGSRRTTLAGFIFSGLVHDLVISVPAGGGYGGPTLFFVIQGMALLAERSPSGRAIGLGRGWRGKSFAFLVVVLPAYGLFHPPFVETIIVPFMKVLGAA